MQNEKKGLSENNSTLQTKSVSLNETTLNFHIANLKSGKEKIEITFNGATHLAGVIASLLKVLKFAQYGVESESVNEKLETYEITDCLELIYKLIPFSTLEVYEDIKNDLSTLNNL